MQCLWFLNHEVEYRWPLLFFPFFVFSCVWARKGSVKCLKVKLINEFNPNETKKQCLPEKDNRCVSSPLTLYTNHKDQEKGPGDSSQLDSGCTLESWICSSGCSVFSGRKVSSLIQVTSSLSMLENVSVMQAEEKKTCLQKLRGHWDCTVASSWEQEQKETYEWSIVFFHCKTISNCRRMLAWR